MNISVGDTPNMVKNCVMAAWALIVLDLWTLVLENRFVVSLLGLDDICEGGMQNSHMIGHVYV
jgi:hypothetical protein